MCHATLSSDSGDKHFSLQAQGLVDSGSNVNCVNKNLIPDYYEILPCDNSVKLFNGQTSHVTGYTHLKIDFGLLTLRIRALVVENLSFDFLIGSCEIKDLKLVRNDQNYEIFLNGSKLKTENNFFTGSSLNNITIEPQTMKAIPIKINGTIPRGTVLEAKLRNKGSTDLKNLECSETICDSERPYILGHNNNNFPIFISKNIPLFELTIDSKSNVVNQLVEVTSDQEKIDHSKFLKDRCEKFGDFVSPKVHFGNLKQSELEILRTLVDKHHATFAKHKYDVGMVKNYRYKMKTKPNHKVWAENQRRLNPVVLDKVKEQFELEIKHGLLEKRASIYAHPLVIVKKPSGDLRVCADLRKANFEIESDQWPIPDIHQLFLNMAPHMNKGKQIYMASFDILMAYRALRVHDDDIEKLAFCFGPDQFCNTRMVFGAKDAPSTFSLLMRIVLNGIDYTTNYLDDLIVIAPDFETFCDTLDKLFVRLLDYGIILKAEKSHIGLEQMNFLGHRIHKSGISIQKSKVDAIRNLQIPKNKDQLRSVLGSFNYHHWQVPDLQIILHPLFDLLKDKHTRFSWTEDKTKAFNKAKNAIASATETRFRNSDFSLVLSVDSSDIGVGAGLGQLNRENQIEYLGYYSKAFSDVEKRYPIRQKELCGIAYAISNFSHLLLFEPFLVLNDHQSLQRLTSTPTDKLSVREFNILYRLSQYNFKIAHISGKNPANLTADMLSRSEQFKGVDLTEKCPFEHNEDFRDIPWHVNLVTENECQNSILEIDEQFIKSIHNIFNTKTLQKAQEEDPLIQNWLTNKKAYKKYGFAFKSSRGKNARLIIPTDLAPEFISIIHIKKGHLNGKLLMQFLAKNFHISNLTKLVEKTVRECVQCIKCKPQKRLQSEIHRIVKTTDRPFSKVFIDLIDLGFSSEEFRYGLSYFDSLTHFVDMVPLKDKRSESVSNGLKSLFGRHGVPESIVCDNGKEFSGVTTELVKNELGIVLTKISPFNAQSNRVERFHREFKKFCRLFDVQVENWHHSLWLVLYFYNIAPQKNLGDISPWMAYKLYPPRDLVYESAAKTNGLPRTIAEIPAQKIWDAIRLKSDPESELKRLESDCVIKKGDVVTIYTPLGKNKSKKLTPEFQGEYQVVKRISKAPVFIVENVLTGEYKKRHIRFIRLLKKGKQNVPTTSPLENIFQRSSAETGSPPSPGPVPKPRTKTSLKTNNSSQPPPVVSQNKTQNPGPVITKRGRKITRPARFRE